jgi:hypothetical protein
MYIYICVCVCVNMYICTHVYSGNCSLLREDNGLECSDTNFDPRHRELR